MVTDQFLAQNLASRAEGNAGWKYYPAFSESILRRTVMPRRQQIQSDDLRDLLKARLESAIEQYGSLEDVAGILRSHDGFRTLTRSTLSRWRTSPAKRTIKALELLEAMKEESGSVPRVISSKHEIRKALKKVDRSFKAVETSIRQAREDIADFLKLL